MGHHVIVILIGSSQLVWQSAIFVIYKVGEGALPRLEHPEVLEPRGDFWEPHLTHPMPLDEYLEELDF